MKKILIVEDDKNINNMICDLLRMNGYIPISTYDSQEAISIFNENIDLVLLDLMLPKGNGKDIIKTLKEIKNVPIIIISAIIDIDMKIVSFELGADDYITKPFHNNELLARIKLALRHSNIDTEQIFKYKDIQVNPQNYTATCKDTELVLSKIEFELLKLLVENAGQVVTKSVLFDRVWGTEDSADENTLNVHISKIRNKLKKINPNTEYIETIWSIGYKMK